MIRSKSGISLEITLNIFRCLIVSLVLPKFLLWQTHHFCLFQLVPCLSVNLMWFQECIFYCAPIKKRFTLLPEGTDIHIQQHSYLKDLNPCLSLNIMATSLLNWKITQTRNLTVFKVFVIWPSSIWNSYLFLISVNLWAIVSLRDRQ